MPNCFCEAISFTWSDHVTCSLVSVVDCNVYESNLMHKDLQIECAISVIKDLGWSNEVTLEILIPCNLNWMEEVAAWTKHDFVWQFMRVGLLCCIMNKMFNKAAMSVYHRKLSRNRLTSIPVQALSQLTSLKKL